MYPLYIYTWYFVLFEHRPRQRSEVLFQLWPELFVERIVDTRAIGHRSSPRIGGSRLLLQRLLAPAIVVPRSTIDAFRWVVDTNANGGSVVVSCRNCNFLEDALGAQRSDPPAARTLATRQNRELAGCTGHQTAREWHREAGCVVTYKS